VGFRGIFGAGDFETWGLFRFGFEVVVVTVARTAAETVCTSGSAMVLRTVTELEGTLS
jgi:hypothetical protein